MARLRERLDPVLSGRYPLHVTVAYAPARRLADVTRPAGPLRVRLVAVRRWQAPERGIYLSVADTSGWIATLRDQLGEPVGAGPFTAQVTDGLLR